MKNYSIKALIGTLCLVVLSPNINAQSKRKITTNAKVFEHIEREKPELLKSGTSSCVDSPYRTIDGTCNNTQASNIEWGATDIPLYRTMTADYGEPDHYNSMSGEDRPSARAISNVICNESESTPSRQKLSSFVFTWGQFLDHDITLTPEGHTEYHPIEMPDNEPLFTSDMPFFRSEVNEDSGIDDYRQQTNLISSYIDGSNVYGSDQARADWLRSFERGKLKTSDGNLLPYNTIDGEFDSPIDPNAPSMAGDNGGVTVTFVAGDVRAAEQIGLSSLHTLFLRLHNSICDRLWDEGIRQEEELYQKARKEVGAIIQAITYNEFLPSLRLRLNRSRGYNPNVQADISNIFATAAYRLGHTMVTDELLLLDDECNPVNGGTVSLIEAFFNPAVIRNNNISPILKGLSVQVQNESDTKIIDNLRNFLFGDPSSGTVFGLDLASFNIQRGRDHGLPDYNSIREEYGGRSARSFRDITRNRALSEALEESYGDINDIDPWIGLLAEDKRRDAVLGPTLENILEKQFEKLRDGDRFFYLHDKALSRQDRDRINRIKLSDVIKGNTNIRNIQRNVFEARACDNSFTNDETTSRSSSSELGEFLIYPNPTSDVITIELKSDLDDGSIIELMDLSGNILNIISHKGNNIIKVNVEAYPSGVYNIRMSNKSEIWVKRFVKINE